MRILITGAAGNLGSFLTRELLAGPHELRLLIHWRQLPFSIADATNALAVGAELAEPTRLLEVCRNIDCIVHFAGVLFAPRPEKFLPQTNFGVVRAGCFLRLAQAARRGSPMS